MIDLAPGDWYKLRAAMSKENVSSHVLQFSLVWHHTPNFKCAYVQSPRLIGMQPTLMDVNLNKQVQTSGSNADTCRK
jgi:hypothetical protein